MAEPRKVLAAAALAGMLAAGFQPHYLKSLVGDQPSRRFFIELPYRKTPGLRTFMSGVRERTRPGDRVALWVPYDEWEGGYSYAFLRASYLLSGRSVLPLIDRHDRALPDNILDADWVAVWHGEPPFPGFVVAWRDADGALWRRAR